MAAELLELRAQLSAMQLWHSERPSEQALASEAPFCIDTLEFTEWLQFVFIERMHALIEQRAPLPRNCDIAPMAEEYFRQAERQATTLLAIITRLDNLLSRRSSATLKRADLSS